MTYRVCSNNLDKTVKVKDVLIIREIQKKEKIINRE